MLVARAGITSPNSSQPPHSLSHCGALEPATGLFWSFPVSRSQHWPSALAPSKQKLPLARRHLELSHQQQEQQQKVQARGKACLNHSCAAHPDQVATQECKAGSLQSPNHAGGSPAAMRHWQHRLLWLCAALFIGLALLPGGLSLLLTGLLHAGSACAPHPHHPVPLQLGTACHD